jgi:hypothetical protein
MQKWRSQSPFQNDKSFAERLEQSGITEDEFRKVLGMDASELRNGASTSHDWAAELESLYTQQQATETPQETDEQIRRTGFLYAAEPLIRAIRQEFREGISDIRQKYSTTPFSPEDIEIKLPYLGGSLSRLLLRTLVLELKVARMQYLLSGETGKERFLSYLKHLRRPGVLQALMREYPLLARSLWVCAQRAWSRSGQPRRSARRALKRPPALQAAHFCRSTSQSPTKVRRQRPARLATVSSTRLKLNEKSFDGGEPCRGMFSQGGWCSIYC